MKLLVTDEAKRLLRTHNTFLQRLDMKLVVGHSGIEILSRLEREKPDLVLLDYEMEDSSGPDLCKDIRELPDFRSIPVLVTIPYAAACLEEECRAAGADGCLVKPVTLEELLFKIRHYLNLQIRRDPRSTVIFEIKGKKDGKNLFFAKTINISEGGIGMETGQFLNLDEKISLNFIIPGTEEIIEGDGRIVWAYEDKFADIFRYGVQFENLRIENRRAIRRFQESILSDEEQLVFT
jgi:CheY-like chemotaxis protein